MADSWGDKRVERCDKLAWRSANVKWRSVQKWLKGGDLGRRMAGVDQGWVAEEKSPENLDMQISCEFDNSLRDR